MNFSNVTNEVILLEIRGRIQIILKQITIRHVYINKYKKGKWKTIQKLLQRANSLNDSLKWLFLKMAVFYVNKKI